MTAPDDRQDYARGPGHHQCTRGPVMDAYAETRALEYPCTNGCGVAVGALCIHPGGTLRKIPCPNRMPHNPGTGGGDE